MKHPLLFILLLVMPALATAQTKKAVKPASKAKPVKVEERKPKDGILPPGAPIGLGPFKINYATIDSIRLQTGLPYEIDSVGRRYTENYRTALFEKMPRYGSSSIFGKMDDFELAQFIDGYRLIDIPRYKFNDLDFRDIRLVFLHDTLICFACSVNNKLKDILEFKYGKPHVVFDRDSVTCTYKSTGREVKYYGFSAYQSWDGQGVSILDFLIKEYDDKCEEKISGGFMMNDTEKEKEYQRLKKEKEGAIKEAELKKY